MLTIPEETSPVLVPERSKEELMEEQRMRDVLLILENLAEREEATVKMILDCLYDIGSVNLINQKIPVRPLNRLMKAIAQLSKPMFRFFAVRWFKKNGPELIADWLHSQVKF